MTKFTLLIASLLLASSTAYAELATNGSFNGTVANGSVGTATNVTDPSDVGVIGAATISNTGLPDDWYLVNTGATLNSPDTQSLGNYGGTSLNNHNTNTTPVASPDGGQWIGVGKDLTTFNNGPLNESFGQMLTGLTIGESYNLSWQDANFGSNSTVGFAANNTLQSIINDPNRVRATLTSGATLNVVPGNTNINYYTLSGSPEFTFTGSTRSLGNTWTTQNFASFQATQSSYFLSFDLADNASSYLSIDGISVTEVAPLPAGPSPVPEPQTWAMLAGGLLLISFKARRRKYNS